MSCAPSLTTMVIFLILASVAIGWLTLELLHWKREHERRYQKLWDEYAQARTELTILRPHTELVRVDGGWVRRFKGYES